MILFRLCSFLILLFSIGDAKSVHAKSIKESEPFDQEYKVKFVKNINILNKLHAELSNSTYEEVTVENLEATSTGRVMENPFLFQGDILLTDDQWNILIENARDELRVRVNSGNKIFSEIPKKRGIVADPEYPWSMPINFYIEPEVNASVLISAINIYRDQTCVRFKRHNQPVTDVPNSLRFTGKDNNGCWSTFGKYNPENQEVSVPRGCDNIGTMWHEIAHALGVAHEQCRNDRDQYVRILWENILSSEYHSFEKTRFFNMTNYGIEYDYGSVMHYGAFAFATRGFSIMTVDPIYQFTIGTNVGPSFKDIKLINLAYCSSTCSNTIRCQNGGYVNPSNCQSCNCPPGWGGQFCERTPNPQVGCGPVARTATSQTQKLHESGAKACYYVITAPPGRQVYFEVTDIRLPYPSRGPCAWAYIEINFTGDFTQSGARTCNGYPLTINRSNGQRLLVSYQALNGYKNSFFSMNYRFV